MQGCNTLHETSRVPPFHCLMVKSNGLALWVLTAALASTSTHQASTGRSLFGRRITQEDHMRVQAARLARLEDRIEKMSTEAVFLAERSRQHREMRLKSSAELRDKVEEFKSKLQHEKETMQKEFEDKLAAVREELGAQAALDRDALEDELGSRHAEERERLLEEAKERANNMLEELKAKMAAEAEQEREVYAQRTSIAEEAKERACEDRDYLQAQKDQLVRQLEETMEMEDASLKRIILKFKARENTLRKNFEAQLREARAAAREKVAPPEGASKRPRPAQTPAPSMTASGGEGSRRAAVKSSSGASPNGSGVPTSSGAAALNFSRER